MEDNRLEAFLQYPIPHQMNLQTTMVLPWFQKEEKAPDEIIIVARWLKTA